MEQPKMQIYNADGTVTEVTPCKLWTPGNFFVKEGDDETKGKDETKNNSRTVK